MNFKNILIAFSLLSFTAAFAEPDYVGATYEVNTSMEAVEEQNPLDTQKINQLLMQKKKIEEDLIEDNIWSKIYSNYHIYKELKKQELVLDKRIERLENMKKRSKKQERRFYNNRVILLKKQV